MLSVQAALFSRLTGDQTLNDLLGGSGRIAHQNENQTPSGACLRYAMLAAVPSDAETDGVDAERQTYWFTIFSGRATEIERRLKQLLHKWNIAATADADGLRVQYDSTGPDSYDDDLQIERKDVRFRIEVIPTATAPI